MRTIIVFSVLCLLVSSCSNHEHGYLDYGSKSEQLISCYEIADSLAEQMVAKNMNPAGIVRTTFVNIDSTNAVTSAGRTYSDAIASRLSQKGFNIIEPNNDFPQKTAPPPTNSFSVTPELLEFVRKNNGSAVLIGYYKRFPKNESVAIYTRVVSTSSSVIVASEEHEVKER